MVICFLFGKRLRNWVLLSICGMGLAIALAQAFNPASSESSAHSRFQTFAANEVVVPASLVPQAKYDRRLAHYATVSRSDGSFRQMFVNEAAIAEIEPGEPLPDGTKIVMETWYSPDFLGTIFVKQKQAGEWIYGSFSADRPDYRMSFSRSCHSCHSPYPDTDFTLTKPLLETALRTQQVQTAFCDRPGRTPCEPEAYIPQAS